MATDSIIYGADTALTFDVSSLGTSSTFVAGRESNEISNITPKYDDIIITCDGILSHASTAPSVGQYIGLFLWASDVSLATTPIDTLDGADSAETLNHVAVLNALKLVASPAVTVATAGLKYPILPFSVREILGHMPKFCGLYLAHNHTGALAASQSSIWSYYGINFAV